jgi:hypothetical protein
MSDIDKCKIGYVYYLKAENGLYKIGRTRNVKQRMAHLLKLPMKCELTHVMLCENAAEAEADTHAFNADLRVNGEWYDLPDWYVESIKKIDVLAAQDNEDYWAMNACPPGMFDREMRDFEEALKLALAEVTP